MYSTMVTGEPCHLTRTLDPARGWTVGHSLHQLHLRVPLLLIPQVAEIVENLLRRTCQVHSVLKHRCPSAWCYELGRASGGQSRHARLTQIRSLVTTTSNGN